MTIGLSIPGVETLHPRETWEPFAGYTVASQNPPAQVPGNITQPVAHYTAADDLIDGDPGESADQLPAYIGAIHRYYVEQRGYAIGYLFAIDWLGGVWELRGFDYKSAANKDHNGYTAPILFLVDGDDPCTAEAAQSARAVWREFRRRASKAGRDDFENRPIGHGQLRIQTGYGTVTPCPGVGLSKQIADGVLDLNHEAPVIPEPEPPQGDTLADFVKIDKNDTAVLIRDGMTIRSALDFTTIEAAEKSGRMSNTAATATVITPDECAAYIYIGQLPYYASISKAGEKRVHAGLFSQVI